MSSIMTKPADARIPVHALPDGQDLPNGAVLLERLGATHAFGCGCCVARSPGAVAFDRLFLARVKGERAFTAVAVRPAAAAAARAIVEEDILVRARFRWAGL